MFSNCQHVHYILLSFSCIQSSFEHNCLDAQKSLIFYKAVRVISVRFSVYEQVAFIARRIVMAVSRHARRSLRHGRRLHVSGVHG